MRKIIITLLLVLGFGAAMATANDEPTVPQPPPTNAKSANGQVEVNVIRNLAIRKVCPCYPLPGEIIAGTTIPLTDDLITANFEITGQPNAPIMITVSGNLERDSAAFPYAKVYEDAGALLIGRWGKFSLGKLGAPDVVSNFTSGLPVEILGARYEADEDENPSIVYCSFLVDQLTAHPEAPIHGSPTFILQVWAAYNF